MNAAQIITGQYVIRFDSAGTELDLPPGATANIQGQSLVLPEGKEGGLTLDQRAMVRFTEAYLCVLLTCQPDPGDCCVKCGFPFPLGALAEKA